MNFSNAKSIPYCTGQCFYPTYGVLDAGPAPQNRFSATLSLAVGSVAFHHLQRGLLLQLHTLSLNQFFSLFPLLIPGAS